MTDHHDLPVRPAAHEAFWPADLFEQGIGWVIVARFKSAGQRVEAGLFLVDAFCLGVKMAIYESTIAQDYRQRIRDHYLSDGLVVPVDPPCARSVVEQAVRYAQGLGFAPHPDYRKAARVFGGVRAELCTRSFTFGHEGKPYYCRGPRETELQAQRIVQHLHTRCGEGNYHFLVGLGDAADIDRSLKD
jgi:hypothetical protein